MNAGGCGLPSVCGWCANAGGVVKTVSAAAAASTGANGAPVEGDGARFDKKVLSRIFASVGLMTIGSDELLITSALNG